MTAKPNNSRAFTLTEVMLSVALVLILLLGVNSVFRMTSDSVGAGQALSTINRDHRAVQATLYRDLQNAVRTESPSFIITSQRIGAFRNQQDYLADTDFVATAAAAARDAQIRTIDLDEDNTEGEVGEPGEVIHPTRYGSRSHRADILSFFIRDLIPRQTGNDGTFAADMSSYEGWVWYGHLAVFDDQGAINALASYPAPGEVQVAGNPNPNNWHAAQWILGRQAILLREPDTTTGQIPDNAAVPQDFLGRDWINATDSFATRPLSPLQVDSRAVDGATLTAFNPVVELWHSRYDLAGVSMNLFSQRLAAFIASPDPSAAVWWEFLPTENDTRFWVKPVPDIPISADGMARSSPIFLRGCSQFMVEYTGDYVTQDPDGTVSAAVPDGAIDFILMDFGATTERRVTRWYGLPRDIDGDGDIVLDMTQPITSADVVPLRDVLTFIAGGTDTWAPFERGLDPVLPAISTLPIQANYAAAGGGMAFNASYTCAWGPNDTALLPKMLRIVISADDPLNRINDEQTFEYVIELP